MANIITNLLDKSDSSLAEIMQKVLDSDGQDVCFASSAGIGPLMGLVVDAVIPGLKLK